MLVTVHLFSSVSSEKNSSIPELAVKAQLPASEEPKEKRKQRSHLSHTHSLELSVLSEEGISPCLRVDSLSRFVFCERGDRNGGPIAQGEGTSGQLILISTTPSFSAPSHSLAFYKCLNVPRPEPF